MVQKDYNFLDMSFQILLLQIDFWIFSHGCREKNCLCNICRRCYVLDNGDSFLRIPNVLVLLPIVRILFRILVFVFLIAFIFAILMVARVHLALPRRFKLKLWDITFVGIIW
jgi:hypothetical protein